MGTMQTHISERSESRTTSVELMLANLVIAQRFLSKNISASRETELNVLNSHTSRHQKLNYLTSTPVELIDPEQTSVDKISREVRRRSRPLYIPGFVKNCPATDIWNTEFFKQKYGDDVLPAIDGDHYDKMPLRDIVDMIRRGDKERQKYLQAVADIFCNHRELYDYLPMRKLFELQRSGFHGAELFMGANGTGSPWHAANEWTFFVNVVGRKHWKFIRPEFTLHMKPHYQQDLIYVVSGYGDADPEGITTYEVTLNPGDLLVFPAWWWHKVKNLTDETIGVAVRFRTLMQQIKSPNPTLSMLQLTTPHQWKNIILEKTTGRTKDDERYLWRALNMVR